MGFGPVEDLARLLPEIECQIKERDERVQGISITSCDERNNRLQLSVRVDMEHFGHQYMNFSFSHGSVADEGVKGIVYKILSVMNHHTRTTKSRESLTG